jgi:choline dehydrogenase
MSSWRGAGVAGPEHDYVIVGGGSAGCVLAHRLSEDPDIRVLLIEAGPVCDDLIARIPAASAYQLRRPSILWKYYTTPQSTLNGRAIYQPRGRMLGGTSGINGMCFVRGHPRDFDGWAELGADGWSFEDCLPYFRRLEDYRGPVSSYRGRGGPLRVTRPAVLNPLSMAFLEAGPGVGLPLSPDQNGAQQRGVSVHDTTIRDGRRETAASAYIEPIASRANLTLALDTQVVRIEFDAARAVGVLTRSRDGVRRFVARREVIVSAGAVGSPQLLMLSGIGPTEQIGALGLPTVADLPGVGQNLQDHAAVDVAYTISEPISLARHGAFWRQAVAGLRWIVRKDGVAARTPFEVGAFAESEHATGYPDLQCVFVPVTKDRLTPDLSVHGFSLSIGVGTVASRGRVRVVSADPDVAPQIDPKYFSEPVDLAREVSAISLARELAAQPAFARHRPRELSPGPNVRCAADIADYVRTSAFGCYHLSGTCRMGRDPLAVVDGYGRVFGVEGLRVCDASIFPAVPNGNTNAAVLMAAERIADRILGRPMLPPERVDARPA